MWNFYSLTKDQAAIREFTRAMVDRTGNLPSMPASSPTDDRVIYSSALGRLSFDPDGNGALAAQQFAIVSTGLAMTEADFRVV